VSVRQRTSAASPAVNGLRIMTFDRIVIKFD
jgi:hypothetical protein